METILPLRDEIPVKLESAINTIKDRKQHLAELQLKAQEGTLCPVMPKPQLAPYIPCQESILMDFAQSKQQLSNLYMNKYLAGQVPSKPENNIPDNDESQQSDKSETPQKSEGTPVKEEEPTYKIKCMKRGIARNLIKHLSKFIRPPKEQIKSMENEYPIKNMELLGKLFGPFLELMALGYDDVFNMIMDDLLEDLIKEMNAPKEYFVKVKYPTNAVKLLETYERMHREMQRKYKIM
jgi:hypothetical protein